MSDSGARPVEVHDGAMVRLRLVARALTGGLDPAEMISIVLHQGMAELNADGAVLLLKDSPDRLATAAALGTATAILAKVGAVEVARNLPATVAVRTCEPVWVNSRADAFERFPELAAAAPRSAAWAALPLIANGETFGVLGISFATTCPFGPSERHFLTCLADIAAPSLLAALRATDPTADRQPWTPPPDPDGVAKLISDLFGMSLTLGSIVSDTDQDSDISRRILEVIDQLDATSTSLRHSIVAMDTRPIELETLAPRAPSTTEGVSPYSNAINAMIAATLSKARLAATTEPGRDIEMAVQGPTVQGLIELCGELLRRYERLSAFNGRRQPALGALEHLILLQRQHHQLPPQSSNHESAR